MSPRKERNSVPIIEQRDIIEMIRRNHQTVANLRQISDAVASARSDARPIDAVAARHSIS